MHDGLTHADGTPLRGAAAEAADDPERIEAPAAETADAGPSTLTEPPPAEAVEQADVPDAIDAADAGEPAEEDAPGADDPSPLERVSAQLEELQRLLARQTEHTARLHEENQRLRQGELRAAQLPLVRDVLRLIDVLDRLIATGDAGADDLAIVREGLQDALARNGVVATAPAVGEPFEPRAHRALEPVATDLPEQHRTIAELSRSGFAWEDGTVIRPAEVRVFKHAAPPDETA